MAEEQQEAATPGQTEPVAGSWNDPNDISDARQAELAASQRAWDQETTHGERRGPFDGVELSGADVFWLAACALAGTGGNTSDAERKLRAAHDDDSVRFKLDLSALHLETLYVNP
jgi:hypothetical protein